MNDPGPAASYPVLVTERNGEYTLRVKELMLIVRGRDVGRAYQEIVGKKRRLIQWATKLGLLDELPEPRRPPALASAIRFSRGRAGNALELVLRRAGSREAGGTLR